MEIVKNRDQIEDTYKWDLSSLCESDDLWQQKFDAILASLTEFKRYEGKLDAENLLDCLQLSDKIEEDVMKLVAYSMMKRDEDTRNSFYGAMSNKASTLHAQFYSATSFIASEILAMGYENLPDLKTYRHYFDNMFRLKNHILSADKEQLLALVTEIAAAPNSIYTTLTNADIKFPNVEDSFGVSHELTKVRYGVLMESDDRVLRKNAFKTFYQSFISIENTLAQAYNSSVLGDLFFARARNYKSAMESALAPNNIPTTIYDNLIKTVGNNLDLMHQYTALRKKALGLEEMHMYDQQAPIVEDVDATIPFDKAKETILEALAPLGEEYISILQKAFDENWIDLYENTGKFSGAYCFGVHGANPYILMNYANKMSDMFTLAHELGHALHSYYTNQNQPIVYSQYTIFLAEIASTVNEALLMDYLLKRADKKTTVYLLNYFMEQFRSLIFRQTMFAEFEKLTHEQVANNEPLTVDSLKDLYYGLIKKYFGVGIVADEEIANEWSRIPHFYSSFYVYQYSTGYSAAIAISKKILSGDKNALEKYIGLLKSGSCDYSVDLLKQAGVDMETPAPIEDALSLFKELLNRFGGE